MVVQDFIEDSAQRLPEKTALVCGGERLRYSQIEGMSNRLANALVQGGLEPGDRVVIWLGNTVEAVVSIFATLKAGGVFVPVNEGVKAEKLGYILKNCGAYGLVGERRRLEGFFENPAARGVETKLVVSCGVAGKAEKANQFKPDEARPVSAVPPGLPADGDGEQGNACTGNARGRVVFAEFNKVQHQCSERRPPRRSIDLDLACLIYTSGSTGEPKGVMSDHSNVVFAASSIVEYLENVEDDIILNVLPLSFDYGLYQLLMAFKFGGTLVLENSFAFPALILEKLEQEKVTGFPGVPTIFTMLLDLDIARERLPHLRYLTNTAAALSARQVEQIREKFYWAKLYSMYGLTETKRTLYLPPEQLEKRPGSVGIAIPGTEVWVEDAEGNRLGAGQTGELVVRGRHVMRGYWGEPDLSARRFRPGPIPGERLCYTGDYFRMDKEGYLYFVGRKDEMIKSRGEKVSPKEVEIVLCSLDGVREAAVIGVPDELLGQAVKAFVVAATALVSREAVMAHCREKLEDFMVPREVEFVEELPKTASGKVDRWRLVEKENQGAEVLKR